jgi:hypothetical protein
VPEAIITDTGSYSDIVFGLLHLVGRQYRPELANLPDQRLWRVDPNAVYGPLDRAARGRINVEKITQHWHDMCRIAVSLHSYVVTAHEVTRMISRDGNPTSLGQAIAHFGRIFKTIHILRLADDEPYRREGHGQKNLVEGRHDLARRIFHGKKGEITRAYYEGMEDQLSALGLVLNCVVLWSTVYMDRALDQLRAQDYPVLDADVARRRRSSATTSASTATTHSTCPTSAAPTGHCATPTPPTTNRWWVWSVICDPAGGGRRGRSRPATSRVLRRKSARTSPTIAPRCGRTASSASVSTPRARPRV